MNNLIICYLTIVIAAHTHTALAISDEKTEVSDRIDLPVYVVLNNTAEMNADLQSAFEKYWTLSTIEFISKEVYKETKVTNDNLYIMLTKNEGIDGNTLTYENAMQVFYLVRNGSYRVNVTGVPVAADANIHDQMELSNAIRVLQDKLSFRIAKEMEDAQFAEYNEAANARISLVKGKKLYITTDDLDKSLADMHAIKEFYSGEVIVVSRDELSAIIENKSTDAAYVVTDNYKTGISYLNSKHVIDAETGRILYAVEMKSAKAIGFSKNDFNALQNN